LAGLLSAALEAEPSEEEIPSEKPAETELPANAARKTAEVVSLDKFRKK
jgi:hypothetical protein